MCFAWSLEGALGILLQLAYFLAYPNYANLCTARCAMTGEQSAAHSLLQSPSCHCHSCERWQVLQEDFLFLFSVCLKLISTVLKRLPSRQRALQKESVARSLVLSVIRVSPQARKGYHSRRAGAASPAARPQLGALAAGAFTAVTLGGLQGRSWHWSSLTHQHWTFSSISGKIIVF